jgi:hypothetical protein
VARRPCSERLLGRIGGARGRPLLLLLRGELLLLLMLMIP